MGMGDMASNLRAFVPLQTTFGKLFFELSQPFFCTKIIDDPIDT